jgi:hypothetical protein
MAVAFAYLREKSSTHSGFYVFACHFPVKSGNIIAGLFILEIVENKSQETGLARKCLLEISVKSSYEFRVKMISV